MPVKDPKELFVMLLSDARQSTERSTKFYQELSQVAQDSDIKEALESRTWISEKDLSAIDRCFELIGEKPVTCQNQCGQFSPPDKFIGS
jgi:ferritin-like metal-binding protein YciE